MSVMTDQRYFIYRLQWRKGGVVIAKIAVILKYRDLYL